MASLVRRRLDEGDRGQVVGAERGPQRVEVVLVVRLIALMADQRGRARRQVMGIGGRLVVLERVVMLVILRAAQRLRRGRARLRREVAIEPAPGDRFRVEQVADVVPGHLDLGDGRRVTVVETRIEVRNHRAVADDISLGPGFQHVARFEGLMGLAGDEVDVAHHCGAELGVEKIVAHGEMLRVVPQRGHGVAVVIAHGDASGTGNLGAASARGGRTGVLREFIHQAVIECGLFRLVGVGVVAIQRRLTTVEPEGRHRIGIAVQQRVTEPVHAGRIVDGDEARLARRIGGMGVSAEIVIERIILLEDHDEMRNWRRRLMRSRDGKGYARPQSSDAEHGTVT